MKAIMMVIRRDGILLKAYPMIQQHHEECDDPECTGIVAPSEDSFEWGLTPRHLDRRVKRKLFRMYQDAEQKARSESLGG